MEESFKEYEYKRLLNDVVTQLKEENNIFIVMWIEERMKQIQEIEE